MSGLYELNEVMDDFLSQLESVKYEILVKSGVAVVFISTFAFVFGK